MKITVEAKEAGKREMFLHTEIGKGSYGDVPLVLAVTLPTYSPLVTVGDRQFVVNIHDIAKAIAEQVEGERENQDGNSRDSEQNGV